MAKRATNSPVTTSEASNVFIDTSLRDCYQLIQLPVNLVVLTCSDQLSVVSQYCCIWSNFIIHRRSLSIGFRQHLVMGCFPYVRRARRLRSRVNCPR
jgi:hypothetical protein